MNAIYSSLKVICLRGNVKPTLNRAFLASFCIALFDAFGLIQKVFPRLPVHLARFRYSALK
jgi:hypothetical protein